MLCFNWYGFYKLGPTPDSPIYTRKGSSLTNDCANFKPHTFNRWTIKARYKNIKVGWFSEGAI